MSYFRSGDPEADFARREHEQEEWLKRRPVCAKCRQHIQDEKLWVIEGDFYHAECAEELFYKPTDYFI
jgi:hypothetical protein